MIRRIRLTNWRAYKQLDLDLSKPVTFLVAPNGVGKTSLIEAVKWATFGKAQTVEKGRAVRLGEQEATVELSLALPSGSLVDVRRTLMSSGKTSFRCSVDNSETSEQEYLGLLAHEWAADPDVLLSLLFGEAGAQATSAFPIREHLAEVFGITPLVEAVSTVDARLKVLGREIKDIRSDAGADATAINAAEDKLRELQTTAESAQQRVAAARETISELHEPASIAEAWNKYRTDLTEYQHRTAELVQQLQALLEADEADAEALVEASEEAALRDLEEQRAAVGQVQLRAASAGSAMELLAISSSVCPTCLRPISENERLEALRQHEHQHGGSSESIATLQDAVAEAERRLTQVRQITRAIRDVHLPTPPSQPDPGIDAATRLRAAEEEHLRHTEVQGAELARLQDAQSALVRIRQSAEENAELVKAYREEIMLQVAKDALKRTVARYMTDRIQPLTEQVSTRWKLLFGSEGLHLSADGSISYRAGDEELELGDLSGGERVVALFITRLLVVASATRATSLWLDEPLEHLDPRRRAIVARTVLKAAQQEAIGQVVVTTYEERLARQLAASAPDVVDVKHIRSAPM